MSLCATCQFHPIQLGQLFNTLPAYTTCALDNTMYTKKCPDYQPYISQTGSMTPLGFEILAGPDHTQEEPDVKTTDEDELCIGLCWTS